ncbi:MAG: hypothetical protein HA496_00635 [Thaumarchaeota archaeon]|nr:hypothetical protein [Nitrososphaerota archaeon]
MNHLNFNLNFAETGWGSEWNICTNAHNILVGGDMFNLHLERKPVTFPTWLTKTLHAALQASLSLACETYRSIENPRQHITDRDAGFRF